MMPPSRRPAWPARNLKSTFNYHAVFNATGKIDFALRVLTRGKIDSEWLLRLQWHEKLDYVYGGNLRIFAPLGQSCEDFIEDHYARHDGRTWEMSGQAGMSGADRPPNFKAHVAKFDSSH